MKRTVPDPERGIILVNVLSVLALCSAVMVAMLTLQDISIERSTRFLDAASANAYALGAETSAIVALRRDAVEAAAADHYGEPWAGIQEAGVAIEGGTFQLSIRDEQGRFNLNNLVDGGVVADEVLSSLLRTINAPPSVLPAITGLIREKRGLADIGELSEAGLDGQVIALLGELACVLPEPTDINLNTASEAVLAAALGNPASARLLASRRDRLGYLTPADLSLARVLLPVRTGFRSDYFVVTATVEYGTAAQSLESRLFRSTSNGQPSIAVWSRKRLAAEQASAPPQHD